MGELLQRANGELGAAVPATARRKGQNCTLRLKFGSHGIKPILIFVNVNRKQVLRYYRILHKSFDATCGKVGYKEFFFPFINIAGLEP
jgi:hypothetical protein